MRHESLAKMYPYIRYIHASYSGLSSLQYGIHEVNDMQYLV
jgi:hypothetical protein